MQRALACAVLLLVLLGPGGLTLCTGASTYPEGPMLPHTSLGPTGAWLRDAGVRNAEDRTVSGGPSSPVLGTYDPGALLLRVGSSRSLYPEPLTWSGPGSALASGANVSWNVSPSWLGKVSPYGTFTAGPVPGNGTITATATWNGTTASNHVPVVVYQPACILLSLESTPRLLVQPGSLLSLSAGLFDQTGASCPMLGSLSFTLRPGAFGSFTRPGNGSTVLLRVNTDGGNGWLNASYDANGTERDASVELSAVPASAGLALQVLPQSARISARTTLPLAASVEDGWGGLPSGNFTWSSFPSSLGTLSTSGGTAWFAAGSAPGSGWINISFVDLYGRAAGSSVPVQVVAASAWGPPSGVYSPEQNLPPLFPGQAATLSLYPTDRFGNLLPGTLNATWKVHPGGIGHLSPFSGGVLFVAGPSPGNGSVVATATLSCPPPPGPCDTVQVAFPVSVLAPAVSDMALFGALSDRVTVGGSLYLEGVDQDLYGNLLLAGGYYGLQYDTMSVSWSLSPANLGTLTPLYNGTTHDLPETALFQAGTAPGSGAAVETLTWAGESRTVRFPLEVEAQRPSAVEVGLPSFDTLYDGIFGNRTVALSTLVLDQEGYPMGTPGSFSWTLGPSDASTTGATDGPTLSLRLGAAPGVVAGNVSWRDGNVSGEAAFLFDVVAPTNVSMLAITPGGPSGTVESVGGSIATFAPQMGVTIEPTGTLFTAGTSRVPGARGGANWTLYPASIGNLSNANGREVNVTVTSAGAGWLNASVTGPDGTLFLASVPILSYVPRLSFAQALTGPCLSSCSGGLVTYAGNEAYVGAQAFDQTGRPFFPLTWSATVAPTSSARALWAPWVEGPGSELIELKGNDTAGNGTLTVTASAGNSSAAFSLPVELLPALPPGAPTGIEANASAQELNLTWVRPDLSGSSSLVNYTVQEVAGNGSAPTNISFGSPPFLQHDLTPGTTYLLRVRAWNGAGLAGPWSPWVEATTWRVVATPTLAGFWTPDRLVMLLLFALAAAALVPMLSELLRRQQAERKRLTLPRSTGAPPGEAPRPGPPGPVGPGP